MIRDSKLPNFRVEGGGGDRDRDRGREIEGDQEIKTFTFVAIFRIWAIGILNYSRS